MIFEDGLDVLFIDPDTVIRKFGLVALFTKHPQLVTEYRNEEITDIVSHVGTKTLDANLVKKTYLTVKTTIRSSAEFALKKAQFISRQQQQVPAPSNVQMIAPI